MSAPRRSKRSIALVFGGLVAAAGAGLMLQKKFADTSPAGPAASAEVPDVPLPAFIRYGAAAALAQKNAGFDWNANWSVPRVALLDKEGRCIAAEDKPRPPLRPSTLAQMARDLRAKRVQRDALWAKAESASGPAKAELLRQGLDVLKLANSAGNGKRYKPVHDAIRAADPEDKSGAIRWLGFGGDPKSGVPWAKPAWNEALDTKGGKVVLTDADYQEALARVDKELADPRNKILPNEYRQRMMLAKYHIYKGWKGHEAERFKVQQEIAALDPTTFWGIGGEGYLGEYGRSPMPYLSYGWKPAQVQSGAQTWTITDTAYFFAQPVPHSVKLSHSSGKDTIKIKRIALGKTWTDVALLEQPAVTLRVDLQDKVPQAKFIRLEHQPVAGKPPAKMQLRNVLVYGRKLY